MSNDKSTYELPGSTEPRSLVPGGKSQVPQEGGGSAKQPLTEKQVDAMVEGGVAVAKDVVGIAGKIVEIYKIREDYKGQVDVIEAKTRDRMVEITGRIKEIQEERAGMAGRGRIAVDIIDATSRMINSSGDLPPDAKIAAINNLPKLVELAVKKGS